MIQQNLFILFVDLLREIEDTNVLRYEFLWQKQFVRCWKRPLNIFLWIKQYSWNISLEEEIFINSVDLSQEKSIHRRIKDPQAALGGFFLINPIQTTKQKFYQDEGQTSFKPGLYRNYCHDVDGILCIMQIKVTTSL